MSEPLKLFGASMLVLVDGAVKHYAGLHFAPSEAAVLKKAAQRVKEILPAGKLLGVSVTGGWTVDKVMSEELEAFKEMPNEPAGKKEK